MENHPEELIVVQRYMADYERMLRMGMQAGMGTLGMEMSVFSGENSNRGMTEHLGQYGCCDESSYGTIQSGGF